MPICAAASSSRAADDASVTGSDVSTAAPDGPANGTADDASDDDTPAQPTGNDARRPLSANVPVPINGVATDGHVSGAAALVGKHTNGLIRKW